MYSFFLNYVSDLPLHEQLSIQFYKAIRKGYFREGQKMPSINQISKELLVSKELVRLAYNLLVETGLLEFRKGEGYFVSVTEKKSSNQEEPKIPVDENLVTSA
jgi:GntR family transcriptional regulator